ncbi:MAG: hypothetical protein LBI15_01130 [Dysgonamonadaceae bacterium]|jgi:hypothetical protein|nr:hypothetical protein [Dysgonamonadaceae bacterium]
MNKKLNKNFANVRRSVTQAVVFILFLTVSLSCEKKDEPEPGYTVVPFDNSKLIYRDIEGNGNLRLEIYNADGPTASNSGLNVANFAFANEVSVTFTLSDFTFSVPLDELPVGHLSASIFFANSDGSVSGNGPGITVTGEGTYMVVFAPGTAVTDVSVFVIDIVRMADIIYMNNITATIDEIRIR